MTIHDIPALNASLNATATVLICVGVILIQAGHKQAHRRVMLTAGFVSAVFLVSYVTHKVLVRGVHTPFGGTGLIRNIYYPMLISHIILAVLIAWLVPATFRLALRGELDRHRKWAKWTVPIWLYVSVTGVLVYFFLYQWWPASA